MRANVFVGPSGIDGVGVFASRDIPKNGFILRFRGKRISGEEALRKGEREGEVLQVGEDEYIDPVEPGRSTNHSCEPNAGIRDDVTLIALRDIRAGEEIRFDYSTTISDGDGWEMDCRCGEKRCRGRVRAFSSLPAILRLRYAELDVVSSFLLPRRRRSGASAARPKPLRRISYPRAMRARPR